MILLSPGCRVTHQSHVALFYCDFIAEKAERSRVWQQKEI
nr:MAG TPA: hypothetical protein [Caudoviricetes sp.]